MSLHARFPSLLLMAVLWAAIFGFVVWDHQPVIDAGQRQVTDSPATISGTQQDERLMRRNLLVLGGLLLTVLAAGTDALRWRQTVRARQVTQRLINTLGETAAREQRLASLFQAIPDPAIAFRPDHVQAEGCNPPMLRLLRLEKRDLLRLDLAAFASQVLAGDVGPHRARRQESLRRFLDDALQAPAGQTPERMELQIDTPAPLIYEVRVERLQDPGAGLLVLLRDITLQHRLERMTNDFAATAAHEMRGPLASILGLSELLAADLVPEDRRAEIADQIRQRANGMTSLVNDLLTLTRLETGLPTGERRRIDLRTVLEHLLLQVPELHASLVLSLPAGPVWVDGNIPELASALRNGVENALKYAGSHQPVHLSMWTDEPKEQARLLISDEGPGIASIDCEYVFERFVRLENGATRRGSGLGLPLIRSILQHHDGWAWIESERGQGVRLHLMLPLAPHDATRPPDSPSALRFPHASSPSSFGFENKSWYTYC